jgi:hypothetical protein
LNAGTHPTHAPSIWQLVLGILGLCITLFSVSLVGVLVLANETLGTDPTVDTWQLKYILWISLAIALVSIPSIVFSIQRISGRVRSQPNHRRSLWIVSAALVLLLAAAWLVSRDGTNSPSALLQAVINVLFVGIPVWWFVELGRDRLPKVTSQKQWGVINFGVFVTLPVIIFVEVVLVLLILLFGMAWLVKQPEFTALLSQFNSSTFLDPQQLTLLTSSLEPIFQKPAVITTAVLYIALIVPMVEELFKPLALWFFIKKRWSPAEGFIVGMLCGAAFAVVESLTSLAASPSEFWFSTVIGRVGTGLLHVFTAGLNGWALTSSWNDGKFLRVGLIYIVTVTIHGVWNLFAILVGIGPLLRPTVLPILGELSSISSLPLVILFALMLFLLFATNSKLRSRSVPPEIPTQPPA